jgi:hypothetical protein
MEPEDPIIQHPAWLLYLIHKLYIHMNLSSLSQETGDAPLPWPFSNALSLESVSAVVSYSILHRHLTVHSNSTHNHLQLSDCPQQFNTSSSTAFWLSTIIQHFTYSLLTVHNISSHHLQPSDCPRQFNTLSPTACWLSTIIRHIITYSCFTTHPSRTIDRAIST